MIKTLLHHGDQYGLHVIVI